MWQSLRALPATVWLVGLISLFNDIAAEMIYPVLPLYVAAVLMAGPKALGWIEGVAEAVSSLLKLVSGALVDKWRRIKGWVVLGYGLSVLARPLYAITTTVAGVVFLRFVDRVGKGLRTSARDALVGLSIRPDQRALAYGLHRALDNLGAAIGPVIAAMLLLAGVPLTDIFWYAAVPGLLVLLLTMAIREPEGDWRQATLQVGIDWRWRSLPLVFRRYLLVVGIFTLGNASALFLLLRANELGIEGWRVALMWALASLMASVLSVPLTSWSDRLGRGWVIALAWVLFAGLLLAMGLSGGLSELGLWWGFAVYGLTMAMMEATEKALVADLVPAEQLGSAFGWFHLISGILLLPAAVGFGWLWESINALAAFGLSAALALTAAVLLKTWVRV